MKKTADLVEEITMASQEQNKGAEQINQAVVQLDTVVQQNASASEELASMSEELLSQASSMKDSISFFKLSGQAQSQPKSLAYQRKSMVENELKNYEALAVNQNYEDDSFEEFWFYKKW